MFEVWLSGLLTNTVQVPASLASFNQWLSWLLETAGNAIQQYPFSRYHKGFFRLFPSDDYVRPWRLVDGIG